ncbi:MAG: hypothetical protein ABJF23_01705 [Bryobacteraceae bacterium]
MGAKPFLLRIVLAAAVFFAGYAALLEFPQPLFPFSVRANSLVLRSDRVLPEGAGKHVLELAEIRLERSPLYSRGRTHETFICNERWRQIIFFNKDYGAGGVAQYPATAHVFLREARIEDDRLLSPRGLPVMGERTLDYFVAHEITHQLTGEAIGPLLYYRLPRWVREGYADYVSLGNSFDYSVAKGAFLAGAREMDFKKSGLYWRFHLMVAYLLDRQHWSVEQLLTHPPSQATVESAVRQENP